MLAGLFLPERRRRDFRAARRPPTRSVTGLEALEQRRVFDATSVTINFNDLSNLPSPYAVYVGGFYNTSQALQQSGQFGASNPNGPWQWFPVSTLTNGITVPAQPGNSGTNQIRFMVSASQPAALTMPNAPGAPISGTPPQSFLEFGPPGAVYDISQVDLVGINWSFVVDSNPTEVIGFRPDVSRAQIQSAWQAFTGPAGDPLGAPFANLMFFNTTTPTAGDQFNAIMAPKLWLAPPYTSANPASLNGGPVGTPGASLLYTYWDSTVDQVFTPNNQMSVIWNNVEYVGIVDANGDYQFQGGGSNFTIPKSLYAGVYSDDGVPKIFEQRQPDSSVFPGQFINGFFEAFSRGVMLDAVWPASRPGTMPAGYSSDAWTNYPNWYKSGPTDYDPGIDRTYDVYAKFVHYATIDGEDFRDVPGGNPICGLNQYKLNGQTPTRWFASAYGFSLDESPQGALRTKPSLGFPNNQWPANAFVNGGPTVNGGQSITITFAPWGTSSPPSAPAVSLIDTRPPQAQPGTPTPTAPGTVTWDVLFNEPVTGVSAANFALVASAGLTGSGNIQVTPASTASAAAWTVTASTGTGSGTLGLNLTNVASIKDASGHALAAGFTGQVYAVSDAPVAPTASIAIPADAQNPTSAATVTFDVTFSQPVTGLSIANFTPVAAGIAGAAVQGVSGSGTTWTVTVGTGSGAGTLGLEFANATGITPAPTGLPVGSAAYTIRQTPVAPALQSISRNLPSPTDQPQVSWTVSFSEAVAGVTAGNFSLVSTGLSGARITQVVQAPGTGAGWTVTALTGSGAGTLRLDMVNANGITDTEGLAPTGIPLQGQSYDVVRGDVPGVRIPIAFWAEPGRRANLVWPRGLVPFTGPATRELTVTLAATGGDGSFAARRDIRGVTVAGTGTGPEISLTGTARTLNAYFRTAGRIGYTPSGESLLPRVLAVSAVTTTDTLAGFDTAAILVRGRTSPGRPTIAPQIRLGTTPADTPLEITYETLFAAANVPAAATRSVEFLLGRVSTGRLEIWDGAEYRVVVPRSPRFASRFEQPLLAPGGRIKWTPRTGQTGELPAFTLRVWDGRLKSADVSQVFVDVTAG
ncbi:MAG: hypothetical protein ACKO35_07455 [Planctomycetaceae bacterium]